MNSAILAQQSTTAGDVRLVRCDANGSLLTIPGSGSGYMSLGNTLNTSAAAYTALDQLGATVVFANPAGADAVSELQSLSLVDLFAIGPAVDVLFFAGDPGQTDNNPFAWTGAISSVFCGKVSLVASDWVAHNGAKVATVNNMGLLVQANLVGSFYVAVVAQQAAAYGAHLNAIYVQLGLKRL